jgi:hypothetical protein
MTRSPTLTWPVIRKKDRWGWPTKQRWRPRVEPPIALRTLLDLVSTHQHDGGETAAKNEILPKVQQRQAEKRRKRKGVNWTCGRRRLCAAVHCTWSSSSRTPAGIWREPCRSALPRDFHSQSTVVPREGLVRSGRPTLPAGQASRKAVSYLDCLVVEKRVNCFGTAVIFRVVHFLAEARSGRRWAKGGGGDVRSGGPGVPTLI